VIQAGDVRGISVTGNGRASAAPDTATLDIGVSVLGPSVTAAMSEATSAADAVLAALRAQGVAELQTTRFTVQPEYSHRGEHRHLDGYRVTNAVIATLRRLDHLGAAMDAAAAAGGDHTVVSGVSFSVEDRTPLEAEARRLAWDDATTKARQLAVLGGVTLGQPTAITEEAHRPAPAFAARAAMAAESTTPMEPGEVTITVSVDVCFGIDA
jgi:uncharacterized protein YggE